MIRTFVVTFIGTLIALGLLVGCGEGVARVGTPGAAVAVQATSTSLPATATALPPTALPATATALPPTPLPPSATTLPPTALPATVTALPPTALPPTALPPTALPPTALPPTALPATATALPPTMTEPTATTLPATATEPTAVAAAIATPPPDQTSPAPTEAAPAPTLPVVPNGYVFPVGTNGKVSYAKAHHDYPATDIFCPVGSTFRAVIGGVVDFVSAEDQWNPAKDNPALRGGLSVAIVGDDGVRYYGSHLSAIADGIVPGVRVALGQALGLTGHSGNARSTPPHLHFGISHPTTPDDWQTRRGEISPYVYLKAWQRGESLAPKLP